jgi:hypothetical protein
VHPAILRFEKFIRKVSSNGKQSYGHSSRNAIIGYVLKADIRHYFDSVDQRILLRILERKIKDRRLICLIRTILQNHRTTIPGKGMPLGNLTSQFFANVYLDCLDHFIKHNLKARYYIRYVDDFAILHACKKTLMQWKQMIDEFLNRRLEIELHPEKSKVIALGNGITLLGYRIFFCYRLLKKSNTRRIWSRLDRLKLIFELGITTRDKIVQSLEGWLAYSRFADTYNLRRRVITKFNLLFSAS